jgi:hypothetical protein
MYMSKEDREDYCRTHIRMKEMSLMRGLVRYLMTYETDVKICSTNTIHRFQKLLRISMTVCSILYALGSTA